MQTFLPYAHFSGTARALDRRRLGKQRVEVLQIYNIHCRPEVTTGWANHPAVKMWEGHDYMLLSYGIAICREWRNRGYNDHLMTHFQAEREKLPDTGFPWWYGLSLLHDSHKAHLFHKDPEYYRQFATYATRMILWPKTLTTTSGMEVQCLVQSSREISRQTEPGVLAQTSL